MQVITWLFPSNLHFTGILHVISGPLIYMCTKNSSFKPFNIFVVDITVTLLYMSFPSQNIPLFFPYCSAKMSRIIFSPRGNST